MRPEVGDPMSLVLQALTHSSWAAENGGNDNERLEFLGDAVPLAPSRPSGLTPKRTSLTPDEVGSNSAARKVPAPISIARNVLELILTHLVGQKIAAPRSIHRRTRFPFSTRNGRAC